MSRGDFNEIFPELKNKLSSQLSEESSNSICEFIDNGNLVQFLILLIKNKNCTLLQFLWTIFKEFDKIREIISNSMMHLLLSSLDESITFFEIYKWFEEFGCTYNVISTNVVTVIYLKCNKYPELKPSIINLISKLDNKENVNYRTIFYIYDEVTIIKPFITNNIDDIKRHMVRSYWYDSINTLFEIQSYIKLPFYSIGWYLLSVPVFNQVILKNNENIYENEPFAINFINYICLLNRWEYLPSIITKLTNSMWKCLTLYFYTGYLNNRFIHVLFHQLKKHNINITKLKSSTLKFNSNSDCIQYLKDNNYYNIFSTENQKNKIIEPIDCLKDEILNATIIAVTFMLNVFEEKKFDSLNDLVFDCSLNLSKRYKTEINYIDSLLENDELGWDKKMIDSYLHFKTYINYIFDQANIGQELTTKYNSYLPLENIEFSIPYRLRIINSLITIYNKLKIKNFQEKYNMIYTNCIALKIELINELQILINSYILLDLQIKNTSINKSFSELIENCDNYNFLYSDNNQKIINLLIYNPPIQSKVNALINIFQLPIQEILPILQKELLINENVSLI